MDTTAQLENPEPGSGKSRDPPDALTNNDPVLVNQVPKLGQTFYQHLNAPKTKLIIPSSFQFKPISLTSDQASSENTEQEFEKKSKPIERCKDYTVIPSAYQ